MKRSKVVLYFILCLIQQQQLFNKQPLSKNKLYGKIHFDKFLQSGKSTIWIEIVRDDSNPDNFMMVSLHIKRQPNLTTFLVVLLALDVLTPPQHTSETFPDTTFLSTANVHFILLPPKLFTGKTANKTVNVSLQTEQQKESPPINREAQPFVRFSADGGANACA